MNILCIYHKADQDGLMSAGIVKKYYKESLNNFHIINLDKETIFPKASNHNYLFFQGFQYGETLNLDLSYFDKILMVDISLSMSTMLNVLKMKESGQIDDFIWIDHHERTINQLKTLVEASNLEMPGGNRDITISAAENLWKYFYPTKIPYIIDSLGKYDTWRHFGTDEQDKIFEWEYGCRSFILDYEDAYNILTEYIENPTKIRNQIQNTGKKIYEYLIGQAKDKMKRTFPMDIGGLKFLVFNGNSFDPSHFKIDIFNMGYDAFASFHLTKENNWKFSLRSKYADVQKVASMYGGGGHKNAAGFRIDFDKLGIFLNK